MDGRMDEWENEWIDELDRWVRWKRKESWWLDIELFIEILNVMLIVNMLFSNIIIIHTSILLPLCIPSPSLSLFLVSSPLLLYVRLPSRYPSQCIPPSFFKGYHYMYCALSFFLYTVWGVGLGRGKWWFRKGEVMV